MAVKRRDLYLYLTLACFLGIILIFIFDGYMGVYDSLIMDNGQYQQKVEAYHWDDERYGYLPSMSVDRGGRIEFTYMVENHRFSEYTDSIEVSLLYGRDKISDLFEGQLIAAPFDKAEVKWSLDAGPYVPADAPAEQSYNLNMHIKRGETERRVVIYINPSPFPTKPGIIEPVPPPR